MDFDTDDVSTQFSLKKMLKSLNQRNPIKFLKLQEKVPEASPTPISVDSKSIKSRESSGKVSVKKSKVNLKGTPSKPLNSKTESKMKIKAVKANVEGIST